MATITIRIATGVGADTGDIPVSCLVALEFMAENMPGRDVNVHITDSATSGRIIPGILQEWRLETNRYGRQELVIEVKAP